MKNQSLYYNISDVVERLDVTILHFISVVSFMNRCALSCRGR